MYVYRLYLHLHSTLHCGADPVTSVSVPNGIFKYHQLKIMISNPVILMASGRIKRPDLLLPVLGT